MKSNTKFLSLLILAIVTVVFNGLTFLFASPLDDKLASFWTAYIFINASFIVIAVLILATKLGKNGLVAEYFPQYFATLIYFGLTFIVNLIFMLIESKEKATANIVINLLIIAAYLVVIIFMSMVTGHIRQNEKEIEENVFDLRMLEIRVNALSYSAKDEDVKAKIAELKEKVHFSDPMVNKTVKGVEKEIDKLVDLIEKLLSKDADKEAVLEAVQDCINKVKIRNQMLLASK